MISGSAHATFRHEALVYDGPDDLVRRTAPFVLEGVADGEPVMVAMTSDKLGALRAALGSDGDAVAFVDMARLGRNPAWIIPAWQRFLDEHARDGAPVRGVGEPISDQRAGEELAECQLHEQLLNVAFADRRGFRLLCPYDAGSLGTAVLHEARCSHPVVVEDGVAAPGAVARGGGDPADAHAPLAPPPGSFDVLFIERRTLRDVRALVARRALEAGVTGRRVREAVSGVHELAVNSVRHGGGTGVLRVWSADDALVCEVRDRGHIADPLAGRRRPAANAVSGRGLWIATQLADLLQIRSGPGGSVLRLVVRAG